MPLSRGSALGVAAALLCGACSRPQLPAPELPLVASEDAPFRAQRPPLPVQSADTQVAGLVLESAVLENGLTLWVANRPGASDTSLVLVARDGGLLNDSFSAEVLQLTTRELVEGGTHWFDGRTVAPPILNGRRIYFGTDPSSSQLGFHVLSASMPSALKILSRTALEPAFADLDEVKLAAMKDAQKQSSLVSSVLLEIASAAAYGQPLAQRLSAARIEELKQPDSAALQRCYHEVFRPDAMALIAVGDITLKHLEELAAPDLGKMVGAAAPPRTGFGEAPRYSSRGRRLHFVPQTEGTASVLVLQPAPASTAVADELPFAVLAELAVGAVRSRANNMLRHEQGLTYGVRPRLLRGRQVGLLVIEADFEESQTPRAISALLDLLEDLSARPVTSAELARSKVALHAELERAAHNGPGMARLAADIFASHGTPERLASLPAQLAAVTTEDVQRVARKYLRPRDAEIAVAGGPQLAQELSALGELQTYRVDRN